jgi:RsiW-degrading membrane proteinase PrsW (M82 family)
MARKIGNKLDVNQLNIISQCRQYGLPLWQCPQFLFIVLGIVIIVATLASYLIGARFINEPELVALIVLIVTAFLLIISFVITKSFERMAQASRMKSEFINIVSHQLRSPVFY